jgi:PPP family 3-phenylpropionic acid transporter
MPYWRLSGFYFFYFATLGALVPYFGLYLKSIGYDPVEIGTLTAMAMLSRIVAPVVWAWIADHRGRRMEVVRVASFAAFAIFAGVFFGTGYVWLLIVMLGFSFFWHASLPLIEVTTLNHLEAKPGAYGRVRLWGSLGFIASVTALGLLIDSRGPWWVLPVLFALMVGIWLYSLVLPEAEVNDRIPHPEPFHRVILRPEVAAFLLACFLMQVSHGPYYTFYSIYLEAHGYSKSLIGGLWAFAVLCEIVVFLLMQRLLRHLDLRRLLMASFALAALRWLVIGAFPESLVVLTAAQVLHAATFGSFHATAVQMVHRFFRGQHQHRGQAIYGSASFGIGGAVGSFYSGHAWETLGPAVTFGIASAAAMLALIVTALAIRTKA